MTLGYVDIYRQKKEPWLNLIYKLTEIIDLNLKDKTMKCLEENRGLFKEFLDMTPKALSIKLIDWTSPKWKSFSLCKALLREMKRQATDWKEIFASHIPNKELIFRLYEELSNQVKKTRQSN